MDAVLDAAIELLAERGPRELTVRDVADQARVNHALVHRHFGTKDELIRAAVARESDRVAAATATGPRNAQHLLEVLREHPVYWRVLARTVLDAPQMFAGRRMPAATAMLGLLTGDAAAASDETRAGAAAAGALTLGWLVFGPHLAAVLGVQDEAAVDATVARTTARLVRSRRG